MSEDYPRWLFYVYIVFLALVCFCAGGWIGVTLEDRTPAPTPVSRPAPEIFFLPCGEIEPSPEGLRV